jgi:hypothetical protein
MTLDQKLEPQEVLEQFYGDRGIKGDDLAEKRRAMSEAVVIPCFPYNERSPALYELEIQYLRENGFSGL